MTSPTTLDVRTLVASRTSLSLAEFATLEGVPVTTLYRRRAAGALHVRTIQAGPRAEIRVPISEIRRLYGDA